MARTLALVVVLIAAALAAFHFLSGDAAIDRAARAGYATSGSASPSDDLAPAAVDVDAGAARQSVAEGGAASEVERANVEPEAPAALAPSAPSARIRGVVLRHDRSPAVGGELVLRPGGGTAESLARYGRSQAWKELRGRTGDDGSFELEFEPQRGRGLWLELFVPWAPEASWMWQDIEPGATVDMGTIVLPLGAQVRVDVVLPDGSPAPGKWGAYTQDNWVSAHRDGPTLGIGASGEGGTVLLERVAPGPLVVEVSSALDPATTEYPVTARAGEVATITHVHRGPALDRRLVVFMRGPLLRAFPPPQVASFELRRPDGSTSIGGERGMQAGAKVIFDDLDAGEWLLDIDDPRFAPLVGIEVRTAALTIVDIVGGIELTFDVRAASDGRAIEGAKFEVRPFGTPRPPPEQRLVRAPTSKEHADRHTFHTLSDPQVWVVEASGFAPLELVFETGFEPRSSQRVEALLAPATSIRGRVVDVHGEPIAEHLVVVRGVHDDPPPESDAKALSAWRTVARERDMSLVVTDAEGFFTTAHLTHTHYDLYTDADPRTCAYQLEVPAGSADVELVLAPHGRLEARLSPPWPHPEDVRFVVDGGGELSRTHLPPRVRAFARTWSRTTKRSDGVYIVEWLPTGMHDVRIEVPQMTFETAGGRASSFAGDSEPIPFLIESGRTTHLVHDVAASVPRAARVRIDESNRAGVALRVDALRWDDDKADWQYAASGAVGGDQIALVQPMSAGRWRFWVAGADSTWGAMLPGEYEVVGDETLELEFDVPLVRGRIALEDERGARLANEHYFFAVPTTIHSLGTDHEGMLDLVLPPGSHGLRPTSFRRVEGGPAKAPVSTFVWTEAGPAEPVLVIRQVGD